MFFFYSSTGDDLEQTSVDSLADLDISTATHGDYYLDEAEKSVTYTSEFNYNHLKAIPKSRWKTIKQIFCLVILIKKKLNHESN